MSLPEITPESDGAEQRLIGGRYQIGQLLGSGATTSVYRAVDQMLRRDVALKLFPPGALGEEGVLADEALLLASLNHQSLVTLLDAGVDDTGDGSRAYLVLELVAGTDLRRRLEAGVLPLRAAAYIGADLADALDYTQGRGIVHRDVKPENVLLPQEDSLRRPRAKLADFGIAALVSGAQNGDGSTARTSAYLSPEQVAGALGGPSSDVYSLGLVILECLTGRVAVPPSVTDSAFGRLHWTPEIPRTLPADWRDLLGAMTSKDGAVRPTPAEAAATFRRLAAEAESSAGPCPVADEELRLANLAGYHILDTPPEEAFDRITSLVARSLQVPISTVSLVDRDRIWFKSHHGVGAEQVGRDPGFCATVVETGRIVQVPDAAADPSTRDNPLVTDLGVRFYAGVPLMGADGFVLGSLSALDAVPRTLTENQLAILQSLADMATNELERHRATLRVGSYQA